MDLLLLCFRLKVVQVDPSINISQMVFLLVRFPLMVVQVHHSLNIFQLQLLLVLFLLMVVQVEKIMQGILQRKTFIMLEEFSTIYNRVFKCCETSQFLGYR